MIRLAAALACIGGAAQAACPVAGDLAGGIRMVLEGGDAELFTLGDTGLVESRLTQAEGRETRFTYARGAYLLESIEHDSGSLRPDSRVTFAFPMRPEETPEPGPGRGWGVRMVANYGDGPVVEMLGVSFGAPETVELGGCSLEVLPMEQRIFEGGALVAREERHFLPVLGFSYPVAWHEDDRVDRYDYVSIEAVE